MISKENLQHISKLSKIHLSEKEFETYSMQIENIIHYLDKLDEINLNESIDHIESITKNIKELRKDENIPFNGIFKMIGKIDDDGFVKGPKMT